MGLKLIRIGWRVGRRTGRHWLLTTCAIVVLWQGTAHAQSLDAGQTNAGPLNAGQAPSGGDSILPQTSGSDPVLQRSLADAALPAPHLGWTFQAMGGADFTYTDNVLLTATDRQSDFITTPKAVFMARDTTGRTSLFARAEADYDIYANTPSLDGFRPKVLLDGRTEFLEDRLMLDAHLATDVQQISPDGQLPATDRSIGTNQTQVLTFGARPTWREHLSDDVQTEVFYDISGVRFLGSPAGNSTVPASDTWQHIGQAQISNGTSFSRFGWSLTGNYQELDASGDTRTSSPSSHRGNVDAIGQYRINSDFSVLAHGGNDWIEDSTLSGQTGGVYGLAGFAWRPSSRLSARAEAGYRYGSFNADAQLNYRLARTISLSATYTRDIQNSQQVLISNLGGVGRDAFGNPVVDPATGLPVDLSGLSGTPGQVVTDPNQNPFTFSNVSFKRDLFTAGVAGKVGRNDYSLSGSYERRSAVTGVANDWSGSAEVGRELTRHLHVSLQAGYQKLTGDAGILAFNALESETKSAAARIDYRIGPTVNASLRYVYLERTTTLVAYRENAVMIGLTKTFF